MHGSVAVMLTISFGCATKNACAYNTYYRNIIHSKIL